MQLCKILWSFGSWLNLSLCAFLLFGPAQCQNNDLFEMTFWKMTHENTVVFSCSGFCLESGTAVWILDVWLLFYLTVTSSQEADPLACQVFRGFHLLVFSLVCVRMWRSCRLDRLLPVYSQVWPTLLASRLTGESIDLRDPWLLTHLVRGKDLICWEKVSISWTASTCQSCLIQSASDFCVFSLGRWESVCGKVDGINMWDIA